MRWSLVVIVASLAIVVPAAAQTDGPLLAGKPVKAKKICRTQLPTGRRISESVCHTQAEWDRIDGENGKAAQGLINQLTRQAGSPGDAPAPVPVR